MAVCITCGTDCDQSFTVNWSGRSASFDCIECMATMVAPTCRHCGCRILGHPLRIGGRQYCCQHCAEAPDDSATPLANAERWQFGYHAPWAVPDD
ncbi:MULTISPECIES: hypothetical protein [unclassified Mycolicibacterium]|uniref:hypothetical protein n=1 Tax=unclassified Mycolicibacterium TaxID=2636767 RepID=UPI001EE4C5FF|nr:MULTISPECIES: hypothetical protein [unclassified Mycolicibacterium]MUM09286.1 hypothetical protein [Mycolicibacterium sp. CBMA 213]